MKDLPGQQVLFEGAERVYCCRCGRRLIGKQSWRRGIGRGCRQRLKLQEEAQQFIEDLFNGGGDDQPQTTC